MRLRDAFEYGRTRLLVYGMVLLWDLQTLAAGGLEGIEEMLCVTSQWLKNAPIKT